MKVPCQRTRAFKYQPPLHEAEAAVSAVQLDRHPDVVAIRPRPYHSQSWIAYPFQVAVKVSCQSAQARSIAPHLLQSAAAAAAAVGAVQPTSNLLWGVKHAKPPKPLHPVSCKPLK